ncbi:methyltransferase domain-containing protein [Ophiostoma piceae UAMH 11346]|uniref:Methyltransferase domain-containing protein n=1 Tax=Ophiostoma piceae (strain UAMH 11346) TaxID=1262450 RepID=S3CSW7_OPHP1|nr:methyltransferase domain-containing protein [Ophiostoma piceae UAMH 11346]
MNMYCFHARVATQLRQVVRPASGRHGVTGASFQPAHCPSSRCRSTASRRGYAVQAGSKPVFDVFNRRAKWMQKERAAANVEAGRQADYLKDEVAIRLCERLLVSRIPWTNEKDESALTSQDIKRSFPKVLDFGANSCNVARALVRPDPDPAVPDTPALSTRIGHLTAAESSAALLFRDSDLPFNKEIDIARHVMSFTEEEGNGAAIAAAPTDDATSSATVASPFTPEEYDLILSNLSLHWTNDLPGALTFINRMLKPDAPFLGAMLGGDTLYELRTSLQLAEQDRRGGLSPHVSPLADVRDVGGLLQRAGFSMLTVDVDDIIVDYPDTFALMADLQAMGESSAILGREMGAIGRDVLLANDAIYRELHGNEDGSIPATFRIIYMIGWHPSAKEPKPLERGSGQINLKDILENKTDKS